MMSSQSLWHLLKRIHKNERGAVSLETVLIIGAIAIPILIFLIGYGWPKIKSFFNRGLEDLEQKSQNATNPE